MDIQTASETKKYTNATTPSNYIWMLKGTKNKIFINVENHGQMKSFQTLKKKTVASVTWKNSI